MYFAISNDWIQQVRGLFERVGVSFSPIRTTSGIFRFNINYYSYYRAGIGFNNSDKHRALMEAVRYHERENYRRFVGEKQFTCKLCASVFVVSGKRTQEICQACREKLRSGILDEHTKDYLTKRLLYFRKYNRTRRRELAAMKGKCSVAGCKNPAWAKGLCSTHYKKHTTPK